jgi:hypothetical protein
MVGAKAWMEEQRFDRLSLAPPLLRGALRAFEEEQLSAAAPLRGI